MSHSDESRPVGSGFKPVVEAFTFHRLSALVDAPALQADGVMRLRP